MEQVNCSNWMSSRNEDRRLSRNDLAIGILRPLVSKMSLG